MKFLPLVRAIAAAECRDGAASSLPAPGWKRREGGVAGSGSDKRLADANQARRGVIPSLNQPCTLPASLAVQPYCLRFAFAFTIDLAME
jgi:hypothetical protein